MPVVCLLSHQRSGSHFLKGTLNCHNEAIEKLGYIGSRYLALPEVFTPPANIDDDDVADLRFISFHNGQLMADPLRWGNPKGIAQATELFLERLYSQFPDEIALADIKINQMYLGEGWYHQPTATPRLLYGILKRGKAIFLRRKNLVRAILSGLVAQQSGVWHLEHGDAAPPPAKLSVDVDSFFAQLVNMDRGIAKAESWLEDYSSIVHSVFYEDLFDEQSHECNAHAFDEIARFAGLATGIPWQSPIRKLEVRRLADVIENFGDFRRKLLPTKYSSMLDDDRRWRLRIRRAA